MTSTGMEDWNNVVLPANQLWINRFLAQFNCDFLTNDKAAHAGLASTCITLLPAGGLRRLPTASGHGTDPFTTPNFITAWTLLHLPRLCTTLSCPRKYLTLWPVVRNRHSPPLHLCPGGSRLPPGTLARSHSPRTRHHARTTHCPRQHLQSTKEKAPEK